MKHFLLLYERRPGRLIVPPIEFDDGNEALSVRFKFERAYREDANIEIVVLSAASLDDVKRTHGRYFYTIAEIFEGVCDRHDETFNRLAAGDADD